MGIINQDIRSVNHIAGLRDDRMKSYRVRIDPGTDNRVAIIYEAYHETKDGQECLATLYIYDDLTDEPAFTLEKRAKWDGDWDTEMETTATAAGYWLVNGEV